MRSTQDPTQPSTPLRVRVNDELTLDAGSCTEVMGQDGATLVIRPPEALLIDQVLDYLAKKPEPPARTSTWMEDREGVAAAALALRWGSYLAVLLDHDKPVWRNIDSSRTSRISDGEMARINIEASAALARWIDICRADLGGRHYKAWVNRAVTYLPMPRKTSRYTDSAFRMLARPEIGAHLVAATAPTRLETAREQVQQHASRVFANALLNHAWRNDSPLEQLHAGTFDGYPLDQRRMTRNEEQQLISFACERLACGLRVCRQLATVSPQRPWPDQVLPYALAGVSLITPTGWTLTESSREIRHPLQRTPAPVPPESDDQT